MKTALIAAIGLGLVASVGTAQTSFTPPRGCSLYLTVQSVSCEVQNYWTCEDEPGLRWIGFFDPEGMSLMTTSTDDFGWVDIFFPRDGVLEIYDQSTDRPTSISQTIANGFHAFEYISRDRDGTELATFRGYDWLTGREVDVAGYRMLEARFGVRAVYPDGSEFYMAEGTEYISPDMNLFFGGPLSYADEPGVIYDHSPAQIIQPGEPGFGVSTPAYGCGG